MTHVSLARSAALLFALAPLFGCTATAGAPGEDGESSLERNSGLASNLHVAAGTDGLITTLAAYDNGYAHPGINAIDIGAPGGSPVFYQLGDLPSDVAGGWLFVQAVREAGLCSQWSSDSPFYNGNKLVVIAYFYDSSGNYVGWHQAAFQHVVPSRDEPAWMKWNNASADRPAWPVNDVTLGNGADGGVYLGSVFEVKGEIYNGKGGGLCTDGSHLHQEGAGRRAELKKWQEVTARKTSLHDFDANMASSAPYDAPSAPCGEVPREGLCDGSRLFYCGDGDLKTVDCAESGLSCTWADEPIYAFTCF